MRRCGGVEFQLIGLRVEDQGHAPGLNYPVDPKAKAKPCKSLPFRVHGHLGIN